MLKHITEIMHGFFDFDCDVWGVFEKRIESFNDTIWEIRKYGSSISYNLPFENMHEFCTFLNRKNDFAKEREPYLRNKNGRIEDMAMNLPEGKYCKDCFNFASGRCQNIFGRIELDEVCDWYPSRFIEMKKK